MTTSELTVKVRRYKELRAMAEELAKEITDIEDAVKQEMTDRDTDELTVDIFKIRWKAVTSSRFDTTAFKLTHKDLYEQYSKQLNTRRFSIT